MSSLACAPRPQSAHLANEHAPVPAEERTTTTPVSPDSPDNTSLSDEELKQIGDQIALLTWERIPYSHCHERIPLSLWQVPFHGSRMPPSEQQLVQIEGSVDRDSGALDTLAKDYFELWEWTVGALLVDALKPERRTAQETRALLADFRRLSDRAEHFLQQAAAPHRAEWRLYAYQLALLHTGTKDLLSVRSDLLALVRAAPTSQETARRAQLLLGMVELALLYGDPRTFQGPAASNFSVSPEAALDSALSHFRIVESRGGRSDDPFTLASLCYRAEALARSTSDAHATARSTSTDKSNSIKPKREEPSTDRRKLNKVAADRKQAQQLFTRLASIKDDFGFQQIAKRRLSEMASRSEPEL